jgi:hypothetical protein
MHSGLGEQANGSAAPSGEGDIADAICEARHGIRRHLRDHAHDEDDVVEEIGARQAPRPTAGALAQR